MLDFLLPLCKLRAARAQWRRLDTQERQLVDETRRSDQRESAGVVCDCGACAVCCCPNSSVPFFRIP